MNTAKLLRFLGGAIIIILLIVDTFIYEISFPLLIAGLCIGAIIEIIGFNIDRKNQK